MAPEGKRSPAGGESKSEGNVSSPSYSKSLTDHDRDPRRRQQLLLVHHCVHLSLTSSILFENLFREARGVNTLVSHALHFTMLLTHRFNCLLRDVVGGGDDPVTTIRSYSSSTLVSVLTGYLKLRTVRGATTMQGRNVTEAILGWAFSDFESSKAPLVYGVYEACLVWMVKGHPHPGVRQDLIISNVAYVANWILGLFELAEFNSKKHYLRVLLRGFPAALQKSLLTRDYDADFKKYLRTVYAEIWCPRKEPTSATLYTAFLRRPVCGMLGRLTLLGDETTRATLEGYHVGGNASYASLYLG